MFQLLLREGGLHRVQQQPTDIAGPQVEAVGQPLELLQALLAGRAAASSIGKLTAHNVMPRPVRGVGDIAMVHSVLDEPVDPPLRSLALIETFGIVYMLEAADAMIKAADVELIGYENVASGYISVLTQGDVAACKAAVAAGIKAVEAMGASVYSSCVIPTPHRDLVKMTRRYAIENLLA